MCLSFVPPCITTCIANEDKRDDKRRSSLLFLHTFPTQHAYLYAITEVYVCYERRADVMSSLLVKFIKLRYCVAAVACSSEERKVPARNAGNKVLVG